MDTNLSLTNYARGIKGPIIIGYELRSTKDSNEVRVITVMLT